MKDTLCKLLLVNLLCQREWWWRREVGKRQRWRDKRCVWKETLWERISLLHLLCWRNLKLHTFSPIHLHPSHILRCTGVLWFFFLNFFVEWHAHTFFTLSWTYCHLTFFIVILPCLFLISCPTFLYFSTDFFLAPPLSRWISILLSPVLSFSSPYQPSSFRSTSHTRFNLYIDPLIKKSKASYILKCVEALQQQAWTFPQQNTFCCRDTLHTKYQCITSICWS